MIFGNGATGGVIGVGMVVSLHDAVSRNADTVMGKFLQLEGVTDKAAAKIVGAMDRIQVGFGALAVGGAMLAALAFPTQSAIEFESAFTGVRKTVNATEKEFTQLESNFRNISKNAPVTSIALSEIGEMAGQLGVNGVGNITKFTDTISKLSVTTNLTAEQGSMQFARIANVMQEPIENIDRMGSTVVSLGNNFATTESEIANFASRMAGAGNIMGLTTDEIFGISAAFSSVGIEAEAGGTAIQSVLLELNKQGKKGIGAFNDFMTELVNSGDGASAKLEELGFNSVRTQRAFLSVAGSGDILNQALANSSKAWGENTALTKEAELRYNTVASQLQIMKNNFTDLFITIGQFFLPVIKVGSSLLRGFANVLNIIASSKVGKVVLSLVAGIGALAVAGGAYLVVSGSMLFASAKLAVVFAAMGQTAIATAFATGSLTTGFIALGGAIWTAMSPFLPLIAIGAALVGIFVLIKKSMSSFNEIAQNTENSLKPLTGFAGLMQKIGGIMTGVIEIFKSANNETFSLTEKTFKGLTDLGIEDSVVSLGTWIARVKAFFVGMGEAFSFVWNIISSVTGFVVDALDSMFDLFGFDLSNATSSIDTWALAGKILAGIILFNVVPALISMAIGVIAATWPILLIMGAIIGLIAIVSNWGSIMDWIGEKFGSIVSGIIDFGAELLIFFATLPLQFLNIGLGIVSAISNGITNGWGALVSDLLALFASLPGGEAILKFFGVGEGVSGGVVTDDGSANPTTPTALGISNAETKQLNTTSTSTNTTSSEKTETVRDINLHLDGKELKSIFDKKDVTEDTRFD